MQHQLLRTIRDEHHSLAAMLDALQMVLARGPGNAPERYFELVASMLVYIKEFSEHVHFPKEVELLFPTVLEVAPDTVRAVARLEKSHRDSIAELVDLQTLLAAWQEDGDDSPRHRTAFEHATARVCQSYLEQIRMEEVSILPAAEQLVKDAQWRRLVKLHHEAIATGQAGALDADAYELMYNRIALWLTRFLTHKRLAHE
jgi:hemerythrin-like domain-containing protein